MCLARHEAAARVHEIRHGMRDILRLADPAHRYAFQQFASGLTLSIVCRLKKLRGDWARRYRVNRDAVWRQLQRPGTRHAVDARLGRAVKGAFALAQRGTRSDIHDTAAT